MSGPTRQQRRRLKALTIQNELTIKADAKFFERHPDRTFRMRLASRSEVEMNNLGKGEVSPLPVGMRLFVLVKNITTGVRMRAHLVASLEYMDEEIPDGILRHIYQTLTGQPGSKLPEIERRLAEALTRRGSE